MHCIPVVLLVCALLLWLSASSHTHLGAVARDLNSIVSGDAASNIGGGSQIGRSGGTSSSHTETTNDGATDVREGRPPTGRGRDRGRGRRGRGRGRGGSRLAALLNVYN